MVQLTKEQIVAIDNYGNRLINKGEGKLYVKE